MARIAKNMAATAALSNAAATKYTVPASTIGQVSHIHVSNTSASAVNFTMSIGADAAGTRIYDAFPIAASTVYDSYGPYFVPAATIIQAFGSVPNQLTLTIDGYELTSG